MRKIEQEMLRAIRSGRNWGGGNTMVSLCQKGDGLIRAEVFLHGNHIADSCDNGEVEVNRETFRSWPTRTTVSRLRALGINASIRKGIPCIDGEPV